MNGIYELTLKELKKILEDTSNQQALLFAEARYLKAIPLQNRFSAIPDKLREVLTLEGERMLQSPLQPLLYSKFLLFGQTGNRTSYEDLLFDRRKRLSVFAMLHLMEGGNRWISGLEDLIWAICDEHTWVLPAHVGLNDNKYPDIWDRPLPPVESVDLFAGDTAFALAEIIFLHGKDLHPWVVDRVKKEIQRRIVKVYFHDPVPQNWEMKTNNWPAVCAACAGGVVLYLEEDSERLAGMIWRVLQSLKNFLSGFDAEGATPEGIAYWQYGFGFYVYFSELLKERTGGCIDLLRGQHLNKIAHFPEACLLSGDRVVNFSDAPDRVELSRGLFIRLNEIFADTIVPDGDMVFNSMVRCWVAFSRNVLWSLFAEKQTDSFRKEESAQQMDYYFKGHK